jgi:dCMP deaminase
MPERMPKDEYYLGIAREVSKRETCFRRSIGVIIVRDDQIISTGYVGAPRKTKDCFERGNCLRNKMKVPRGQRYELCRSVHAEQNAIINAARAGVSLFRGTMYIWGSDYGEKNPINAFPCFICKKMIINAGLERVVCSTKDGKMEFFDVIIWQGEWRSEDKDIIDDAQQYGK